ncbi:putative nuclear envelope pore membrane protein POM 121B [Manis javanica]|nr:putative nuclear envelope pore membrane protein POM 121B [Manis javanica]
MDTQPGTTTSGKHNSWDSPPMPSSSWPHRRKFQLVPSRRSRRGIPLILPPAPMFSYSITTKDCEREMQA